jgi:membrane protein involved in colicin uptake
MNALDIPAVQKTAKSGSPVERMATAMALMAESARCARKFLAQGRTDMAARQLDDLLESWDSALGAPPRGDAA